MITIEVTEDDIRNGQQCSSNCCAIAIAAYRVFNLPIDVGTTQILVFKKLFILPDEAIEFIEKFDRDRTSVQPFSFKLNMEEPCVG